MKFWVFGLEGLERIMLWILSLGKGQGFGERGEEDGHTSSQVMIDHFQGFKLGVKQNEFDSFTPFLTLHARAFLLYEGCHLHLSASAILLQKSSPEGWIGFSPWGFCPDHHIKNFPSVLVSFYVSAPWEPNK